MDAQRRFQTIPLKTPAGEMYPCVGVYTIDGVAAGAYVRLSSEPIVTYTAMDAPLLIQREEESIH